MPLIVGPLLDVENVPGRVDPSTGQVGSATLRLHVLEGRQTYQIRAALDLAAQVPAAPRVGTLGPVVTCHVSVGAYQSRKSGTVVTYDLLGLTTEAPQQKS
jgi:hypothetical protein